MSSKRQRQTTKRRQSLADRKARAARQGQTTRQTEPTRQVHSPSPTIGADDSLAKGVRFLSAGHVEKAEQSFLQALLIEPRNKVALNCLGIAQRIQGQHQAALESLGRALNIDPKFAEALSNLGNVYRDLNQLDNAERVYRQAIEAKRTMPQAHNNLGTVLLAKGQLSAAIEHFHKALALQPDYVEAMNNLANAHRGAGNLAQARDIYERTLQLAPGVAEVHNNLANVMRDLGHLSVARKHYQEALQLQPNLAEASDNLGTVLVDLGELDAAAESYEAAAQLRPESADLFVNLGNLRKQLGSIEDARDAYARAAALEPHNRLHELRQSSLCPVVFATSDEAQNYRNSALRLWTELADSALSGVDSLLTTRLAEPSFALQFLDGDLRPLKEAYARIYEHRFPQRTLPSRRNRPRLGLVVTQSHEGIFLKTLAGVLDRMQLDPSIEIVIICPQTSVEKIRCGLKRPFQFLPLPGSFLAAEQTIHEAAFDVLYYWEIGTDATNYFLPFLRLAPIQCTSWGMQVTSGIGNVDVYLTSSLSEHDSAASHYSEQINLAGSLLSYQYRDPGPKQPKPRAAFGLLESQHVYLCAQQLGKIHPDFDPQLAGILRQDPRGVIVLLADRFQVSSERLKRRFSESMPDVASRIHFVPRLERSDYVSLVQAADVVIDPPHFSGFNTTYDAILFEKAVVTLPSLYQRGRYTLGCYRRMGISDWIAKDTDEFVELSVGLANHPEQRRRAAATLREAGRELFEDQHAVHDHERVFSQLIDLARQQESTK